MNDRSEAKLLRKAKRRTDGKLAFRAHAIAFVLIGAGLVAINLTTTPDYLWFYWPIGGWAIGLIAHGLATHARGDLREDMVQAELERLRARKR